MNTANQLALNKIYILQDFTFILFHLHTCFYCTTVYSPLLSSWHGRACNAIQINLYSLLVNIIPNHYVGSSCNNSKDSRSGVITPKSRLGIRWSSTHKKMLDNFFLEMLGINIFFIFGQSQLINQSLNLWTY